MRPRRRSTKSQPCVKKLEQSHVSKRRSSIDASRSVPKVSAKGGWQDFESIIGRRPAALILLDVFFSSDALHLPVLVTN